jgi:dihydroorotase
VRASAPRGEPSLGEPAPKEGREGPPPARLARRTFLGGSAALAAGAYLQPAHALARWARPPADLLISGGTLIDPARGINARRDIAITGDRITRIAERIAPGEASRVIDATGQVVTPGLIDIHVHVYAGVANVGIEADRVGVERGVSALLDGGSSGSTTFAGFRRYVVERARTRVYALLNISSAGMTVPNETALLSYLNPAATAAAVEANRDVIVGLKARMLAGPDGQDVEVMRRTREAADLAGVPITVHIGGQSSPLSRILEFLKPGDVITHALRREGSILDPNGRVYPEVVEAVRSGVHLDVGHGRGNLDFDVAEAVLQQGVLPTVISSDVHAGNFQGPVFDLPTTLSKFLHLGMTLEQVVERATSVPGKIFRFGEELGTLQEGGPADLSLLEVVQGDFEFEDSGGKRRRGSQRLVPVATLRAGALIEATRAA